MDVTGASNSLPKDWMRWKCHLQDEAMGSCHIFLFALLSLGSLGLGEASSRVVNMHNKPYGDTHVASNWGLQPTASKELRALASTMSAGLESHPPALAKPLEKCLQMTAASWETLSQGHPAKTPEFLIYRNREIFIILLFVVLSSYVLQYFGTHQ